MSRSADYTIKGFQYQFNKTLLEILRASEDSVINVEGVVEDVEIVSVAHTTAIQCKYHETADAFSPSKVYKPLLQMMTHFQENQALGIRYVIFAHFPILVTPAPRIKNTDIQAALQTKNVDLIKLAAKLKGKINVNKFLNVFTLEFGPSYDELVAQVVEELKAAGFDSGDVEIVAYPNAINAIAGLSIKHDATARKTTKRNLISELRGLRKTAISKWTLSLTSRSKLLKARRGQLKINLDKNVRRRYLVIDSTSLEDFDIGIVIFLIDYLDRYHIKQAHIHTPLVCIKATLEVLLDIQFRLHQKGALSTDGKIGNHFDTTHFFREPLVNKAPGGRLVREFSFRLLRFDDHKELLNEHKCDDLFLIGESSFDSLDAVDVNVEKLAVTTLKEVKYLMGMGNVYD